MPTNTTYTGEEIVRGACPPNEPNGILPIPSYYSGRGPLRGDLDTHHLEKIHSFIKKNVGEKESQTFTHFVHNLEDLSATAFLEGFLRLADEGFKNPKPEKGHLIRGHGKNAYKEAGAYILGSMSTFAGRQSNQKESNKRTSEMIKNPFMLKHANDLPKGEEAPKYINPYSHGFKYQKDQTKKTMKNPTYLILPGRHLIFTRLQEELIQTIAAKIENPILVFALTSANQENCRYNPLSAIARSIQIDRFASTTHMAWRIVEIPHFHKMEAKTYCQRMLKSITNSLEEEISPKNSLILTSTPHLIKAWGDLGYPVHTMERTLPKEKQAYPIGLIKEIAETRKIPEKAHNSSKTFLRDYPEHLHSIQRIWNDPIFTNEGDLAPGRNYDSYNDTMHKNIRIKLNAIREYILPGRIADEGCADGSLLQEISKDHPESDLIGVDGSSEMIARAREKIRTGAFNNTFVHFYCQNMMNPVFHPESINTTISNSSLHEIYSYNGYNEDAVLQYLRNKFLQTKPGGVFLARDVVGPWNQNQMETVCIKDRILGEEVPLEHANYATRAYRMFSEISPGFQHEESQIDNEAWTTFWKLSLGTIMEFGHKMDYAQNWDIEIKERFCFWNHQQWIQALQKAGFQVDGDSYSYADDWIYENRIRPEIMVIGEKDRTTTLKPDTHQILIARKPL